MYIHELTDWPKFRWNREAILEQLIPIRHQQGLLIGKMESLGFNLRKEAVLQTLTQDVVKSSEIEGELLDTSLVRSSIARRLGIEIAGIDKVDRNVEGVVEMMLDATQKFQEPITKDRLFAWHASLFPTGRSGLSRITVGQWRKGPMEVVSGYIGKEKVHFEAPSPEKVDLEMDVFLDWLNGVSPLDPIIKAGISHLWFVTIHPFDDGNGRIGRAIVDYMLAKSEKSSQRFYSLSSQIQQERKDYYKILEQSQKGDLEITKWLEWFINCLGRAIQGASSTLNAVLFKSQFWQAIDKFSLNERQKKIINLLLNGFEGKLTSSKFAKIIKCSQDTAYRDILELLNLGILTKNPEGGRSTSYSLVDLPSLLLK
ncbi:Fic family protein [Candidatus Odyssella thessalonicensis]|uniref:Fic family protein n=1 Tax=Candidatus Odyssella thessalonicensis TaxID=84647 RepID=UPI000225ACCF|nr:Fic family protein [Candidatus Odyssella thessalonicensis]